MSHHILRRIRLAHCKRGPERCPACRAADAERICLLDVDPPGAGHQQRPVLRALRDGEEAWREFDVVKVFAHEDEARAWAREHEIDDVSL